MKTIQLTVQVPDDLDSINNLELYVDRLGQKLKRELFSSIFSQMNSPDKHSDSAESTCPSCKKKRSISWGNRPRTLKTVFGDIHLSLPRKRCHDCQHTWSISTPLFETTHPLDGCNITQPLRKMAILCGSSWPFRQAADVLSELTGVYFTPRAIAHFQRSGNGGQVKYPTLFCKSCWFDSSNR